MKLPAMEEFMDQSWSEIQPYFQELESRDLDEDSLARFLEDWSSLRKLIDERYARLQLANAQDTTDQGAETRYHEFLEDVYPPSEAADQVLKEKLLESELEPDGMALPLQKMKAEAELFREENLPLMSRERMLGSEYNKILGAQSIQWKGEELTLVKVRSELRQPDRQVRRDLWTRLAERQLEDRQAINDLWVKLMDVREQLAANAGKPDYRAFRWQQMLRLDYTPEDSRTFLDAIRKVVVPAASRVYQRYRELRDVPTVRPWDVLDNRTTFNLPAIQAFDSPEEFVEITERIFHRLDPQIGAYFGIMREKDLLDLPNRKGKGPGAFCTSFATQGLPFIFMNAVGSSTDVRTLFHEAGHAFHVFERSGLPYHHQWRPGMEFNEVASTAMELLASPYLAMEDGFFSEQDAARVRRQHLESKLLFWPYMAVVVDFQHWVYENHQQASDPEACDLKWSELVDLYLPEIDWSGLEDVKATGWQRKLHICRYPFYYIEYGLSLLGAVQIWKASLENPRGALAKYRQALALGGTASLPELYETAGAKFAFDAPTLKESVDLMEKTLVELSG
jgi:oligoendopeptidase F